MSNKWEWIKANEREPITPGRYYVKMHTGSMSAKTVKMLSDFTIYQNGRSHWSGAFDWNFVEEWLEEGAEEEISKDEKLIDKIRYATSGMCHNDLAADRCAKEVAEIAIGYFTEKVSSLKNKYNHGELNDIYNLAIFDMLEILK